VLSDPAPPPFGSLNGETINGGPPLGLDADDGPFAGGADPADRDPGRQSVGRSRPGQPHHLPTGRLMKRANGFTLVEMLIALSIFGMLTAAGVALLGVTARTQETSDRLLAELGEIQRTGALLNADLAQATPRLYRDLEGRPQRAFMEDVAMSRG
jgi:general secretion pathway protein J